MERATIAVYVARLVLCAVLLVVVFVGFALAALHGFPPIPLCILGLLGACLAGFAIPCPR